jgi:hypothetical protein
VFQLLTKYLVSHRQVAIPSIGSFIVEHQPARYDVADKIISPPAVNMVYREDHSVAEDQVEFLSNELKQDKATTIQQLSEFGKQVRKTLNYQAFHWNGIGELELLNNSVSFVASSYNLLEPVSAERVIHRNAEHLIRVGETQVSSNFHRIESPVIAIIRKKNKNMLFGWLILLIAIGFIIFLLYRNNWNLAGLGQF